MIEKFGGRYDAYFHSPTNTLYVNGKAPAAILAKAVLGLGVEIGKTITGREGGVE